MKLRWKIISCIVLMVAAFWCAWGAITSISGPVFAARQTGPNLLGAAYVLRDCGGNVAVYDAASLRIPLRVTDIETAYLRQTDRELLEQGLAVSSEEELLMLLEDLGS